MNFEVGKLYRYCSPLVSGKIDPFIQNYHTWFEMTTGLTLSSPEMGSVLLYLGRFQPSSHNEPGSFGYMGYLFLQGNKRYFFFDEPPIPTMRLVK
jgi:hypothetical protein